MAHVNGPASETQPPAGVWRAIRRFHARGDLTSDEAREREARLWGISLETIDGIISGRIPEPPETAMEEAIRHGNEYFDRQRPGAEITGKLETIDEILNTKPRRHLIKGLAGQGDLVVFYGPPKCGKTFFVFHTVATITIGRPWFGRAIKAPPGFFVYCALEGGAGLRQRLLAMTRYTDYGEQVCGARRLLFFRNQLDLSSNARACDHLLKLIAEAEQQQGLPCIGVVIDTASRALAGASDNDPEAMGRLIENCDRIRATGPAVIVIHHTGKVVERGPRGSTVLFGAIDTQVFVEKVEGAHRATVQWSRDDASDWAVGFQLDQVEVETDEDGDPITSCVVTESEAPPEPTRNSKRLEPRGANQKLVWRAFQECQGKPDRKHRAQMEIGVPYTAVFFEELRAHAYELASWEGNACRKRFAEAVDGLVGSSFLTVDPSKCWVWAAGEKP